MTLYKLILVGDSGTGKTAYINRVVTGNFERSHIPTLDTTISNVVSNEVPFTVWDIPSTTFAPSGLENADCAIIMFDVLCMNTYINVKRWYHTIRQICGDIPIVLCGNKVDVPNGRIVTCKHIKFHRTKPNIQYCDISAKSCYNFERPFIWLGSKLAAGNSAGKTSLVNCGLTSPLCGV